MKLSPEKPDSDCFLECIGYLLDPSMQPYRKTVKRFLVQTNALGEGEIKELMRARDFSEEDMIEDVAAGLDRGIIVHVFEKEKMTVIYKCNVDVDDENSSLQ